MAGVHVTHVEVSEPPLPLTQGQAERTDESAEAIQRHMFHQQAEIEAGGFEGQQRVASAECGVEGVEPDVGADVPQGLPGREAVDPGEGFRLICMEARTSPAAA